MFGSCVWSDEGEGGGSGLSYKGVGLSYTGFVIQGGGV